MDQPTSERFAAPLLKAGALGVLKSDDALEAMWQLQREMFTLQGTPVFDFTKPIGKSMREQLTHWVGEFCKAIVHEAVELEDWFPWKHWSEQPGNKQLPADQLFKDDHLNEARTEVIDLFHFVLSAAILLGMDSTDIYERYCGKMKINVDERHASEKY